MFYRPDSSDIDAPWSQSLYILLLYIAYYCRQYINIYQYSINKIERYSLRDVRDAWRGEEQTGEQGGPATYDRGQIRVETGFTLNEDEV